MKNLQLNIALILLLAAVCTLQAAHPAIGVAIANGSFLLDRSTVIGNANIFDGSTIETQRTMSDISLQNGLKMRLGIEARGRVFQDRLVLEKGAGQVSGSKYQVEAGMLRIVALNSFSTARVAFGKKDLVEVAALTGRVRVETATGITVANMESGTALSFAEQAGASTPTTLCGKVERKGGELMLLDVTTKVSVQLKGTDLDQYAGKSVAVTGNLAGAGVLQVLTVKADSCGGGKAVAGGAGAGATGGAATAGTAGGLSTAAIAGIAIGGAAGLGVGLAGAAGAFSGTSASH